MKARELFKGSLRPPDNDSAFLLHPHNRGVPNVGRMARYGNQDEVDLLIVGCGAGGAVLAQRLARKLCTHCCEMYTPTVDDLIKAKVSPDVAAMTDGMALYRKRGCPRCNQTGYRGRIGIFQLMTMNEELETLAAAKASREEIERAAMTHGMRTLWDDGLAKVAAGLTSVEELTRVTV